MDHKVAKILKELVKGWKMPDFEIEMLRVQVDWLLLASQTETQEHHDTRWS